MPLYEPTIPARYAAPLVAFLSEEGSVCLAEALKAARLEEGDLVGAETTLTMTQFDALHCAICEHLGRDDIGFELGSRITIDDHRALGLALRQCQTVNELLQMTARFSRLVTPSFSFHYRRYPDRGEMSIRPAAGMSQATLHAFEELIAVSINHDYRRLLGTQAKMDIYLSMPAPKHIARYRKLRPTRFHFSAMPLPEVCSVFPGELLDQRLNQSVPNSRSSAIPDMTDLQAAQSQIPQNHQWSAWVSLLLREADGCQPTRQQLAELINVSETTLTRNLGREGQNLRALGHSIRLERACRMLRESRQSISQIAYRLGYGGLANFSATFRSALGVSPRTYRNCGESVHH